MNIAALALAAALAVGGLYVATHEATAQPNKLFIVGQQYGVLYSCLNQVGCYGEIVTIREVRSDGWLVITTEDGRRWTVNSSMILSFTPINPRVAEETPR